MGEKKKSVSSEETLHTQHQFAPLFISPIANRYAGRGSTGSERNPPTIALCEKRTPADKKLLEISAAISASVPLRLVCTVVSYPVPQTTATSRSLDQRRPLKPEALALGDGPLEEPGELLLVRVLRQHQDVEASVGGRKVVRVRPDPLNLWQRKKEQQKYVSVRGVLTFAASVTGKGIACMRQTSSGKRSKCPLPSTAWCGKIVCARTRSNTTTTTHTFSIPPQ